MEKVIVFGRGNYFRRKYLSIIQNYKIMAFFDNAVDEEKYDDEYQCTIYNPMQWKELEEYPILLMSVKFTEMWRQLIKMGVPANRIRLGIEIYPYFDQTEEMMCHVGNFCVTDGHLVFVCEGKSYPLQTEDNYKKVKRHIFEAKYNEKISWLKQCSLRPVTRAWGSDFGKPIDRVYIEEFLEKNRVDIKGNVMEVGENTYTRVYGGTQVTTSMVMHVDGTNRAMKINLETGEGVKENLVDCFICTQTLFYIYNLKQAVNNIYRMLRPDGTVLVTVPGISCMAYGEWGDYWRFTKNSLKRIFADTFEAENVCVESFGNVKTAMAFLYGLCAEQLHAEDFLYNDERCQLLIAAKIRKRS